MKELYKKDPKFFLVMLLIILVVVFFIGKFIYSEYKKNKQKQVLENSTTSTNVNGVNLSINLGSVAQQIHSAFYDNDWFGWTEDEEGYYCYFRSAKGINTTTKRSLFPVIR